MDNHQLLYDDQSIIKQKQNAIFTLMFMISNGTKLHFISNCILVFLEDIQLMYFVFFNSSVLSMNEKLREVITYLALDGLKFDMFKYILYVLCILYLIGAAIIVIYVLFIHPEKYKENYAFKYLRAYSILFNSVFFPVFTHGIIKIIIPKDQKIAAYPNVTYFSGDILLSLLALFSIVVYLFLQFLFVPFVYINPTPFKKNNSLCQTYSFLGLSYNVAVFLLVISTQVLNSYKPEFSKFIFIFLFLYMLYATSELLKKQPYYNKHINNFRAGMWLMILGMTIIDLFALLFGKGKSFFSIIVIAFGVCLFFVGNGLNRFRYKKHIDGIYRRFKAKKIEDKNRYNRENGIESSDRSSNRSSENGSRSSYSSSDNENNEVKLISVDSDSQSDNNDKSKKKKNKKRKEDNEGSEDESDEEESEEYDSDSDSNNSGFAISDRISERITSFGTIRETVYTKILNEPIIVYEDLYEFELACRFIWNNETREAFELMKELYNESINQYNKNPYINTFYSYYLLYINERMSKSDKDAFMDIDIKTNDNNEDEIEDEDENNEENEEGEEEILDEEALNRNNPDFLLTKALSCKLNYLGKYFVRYLIFEIKEKKKEDKDYYKKEALELLQKMQHEAVEKHITILDLLKKFFTNIKYINSGNNSSENFDMDKYLEATHELKKYTLNLYQDIITKYPDEKSTYQLYTLFMTEVINQTDSDKYMLTEGDSYMVLNGQESKKVDGASNAGGSTFGDSESKKRKMQKNNMIHSFTDRSRFISKLVIFMFVLISGLYIGSMIYGFIHINNFNQSVGNIKVLQDMNYNVHNLLSRTRMMIAIFVNADEATMESQLPVLISYMDNIEDQYIPILKKYSLSPASSKPVVVYSTDSRRSEYVHYNGYELVKNIVVWGRGIFGLSAKDWIKKIENGENVINDYRVKMFAENFQYYYDDVIAETMDEIYNDEIESKNVEMYIIYGMTALLVFLSLSINLLGITPLYRNSRNLYSKTLRMFKYLLKGSINDIISKFEVGIESITETYDISFDNKKNKYSDVENQNIIKRNYKRLRGVIINVLLISAVLLLTLPIIIKDKSIIKNLNYNLAASKRKDMIIFSSIFSYEVIIQDNTIYPPGIAETYLSYEIQKLETIQRKLYKGELGLDSTKSMRNLDELLITRKCRDDSCDTMEENPDIGITRNLVEMYYNELVDEYIEKIKAILNKSNLKDYKTTEHMYENNQDYTSLVFVAFGDPNFSFELNAIQHLFAGLERFDEIVYNDLFQSIRSTLVYLIFIIFIGIVLIFISAFITYRMIKNTNQSLNELVNMIFIIPPSTVNMIPQFKRFIETGSFEE